MQQGASQIKIVEDNPLKDKWHRLNNLYWIIDDDGKRLKFKLNPTQQRFFDEMWYRNNILKSRQLGFTTFIDLYILDEVVFNSNVEAGIIAHRQEDAKKIFRRKIKYPYDSLPDWIKENRHPTTDSKEELVLSNNSTVYVSVSMRSGTVQYLHISELGYICNKYPDRAEEIVTGALPALHAGHMLWVESTAKGREGKHYEWCKEDQDFKRSGQELTLLDRKFFFFPWHGDPRNELEGNVVINKRNRDYFAKIEAELDIKLNDKQKAWYIKQKKDLGELMLSENPSTPEEAFQSSIEGAYFANEMVKVRETGRICGVPLVDNVLVQTCWDLGLNDFMAIWWFQIVGREVHFIDYYENSGEGFPHYKRIMVEKAEERKYLYGKHWAPHDISVHEMSDYRTRWESAKQDLGIKFEHVSRVSQKMDAIEAARGFLSVCWFDEVRCEKGISRLDNYTKRWNDHLGCYADEPKKDDNRHGADSFQTIAIASKSDLYYIPKPIVIKPSRYVYT